MPLTRTPYAFVFLQKQNGYNSISNWNERHSRGPLMYLWSKDTWALRRLTLYTINGIVYLVYRVVVISGLFSNQNVGSISVKNRFIPSSQGG